MRAWEFIVEADQTYIDQLRSLVDQGFTSNDIADKFNKPVEKIRSDIKRHYPDREKKFTFVTPDTIETLKNLWDEGWRREEIAELMGLKLRRIDHLLSAYYPNRPNKQFQKPQTTLGTPDVKREVADLWRSGMNLRDIGKKYEIDHGTAQQWIDEILGQGTVKKDVELKRSQPGTDHLAGKVTPEMLKTMRYLYQQGTSLTDISDKLGNVVVPRTVLATMVKQPDYAQLRADWEKNRQRVAPKLPANRKIYRAGTIDNRRSKGPSSKHMYGVFTPKKI